jgi:hypothetical protein
MGVARGPRPPFVRCRFRHVRGLAACRYIPDPLRIAVGLGWADSEGEMMSMRAVRRAILVVAVAASLLLASGCGPETIAPASISQPTTTVKTTSLNPTQTEIAAPPTTSASAQAAAASASASAQAQTEKDAAAQAQAEQDAAASAAAQAQAEQDAAAAAAAEAAAASQSAAEQAQQAPAPASAPQDPGTVTAGAFCSPEGAVGVTVKGTPMVCKTTAKDSRDRWRSAG